MEIIVQKFGGSSVANVQKIRRVASIVSDTYSAGKSVVVVVSAQGDTTDDLLEKASQLNKTPSLREMDMLLSCGEQISIALLAMALDDIGVPAVSLTGWQAGINTEGEHSDADIVGIDTDRILSELSDNKVVIVAGFQGINAVGDITTLGRGGSDTSAVALAAYLNAGLCQIYTDVDGVYDKDPRRFENAKKFEYISYAQMIDLAASGAKVLALKSVETAQKHNVKVEVLSTFSENKGTLVF